MDFYAQAGGVWEGRTCPVCQHDIEFEDAVGADVDGEVDGDGGTVDHSRVQHWSCYAAVEQGAIEALIHAANVARSAGGRGIAEDLLRDVKRRTDRLARQKAASGQ